MTQLLVHFAGGPGGYRNVPCADCKTRLSDLEKYPDDEGPESLLHLTCWRIVCVDCIPAHGQACKPPPLPGPKSCPRCSSKLELGGEIARCVGCKDRQEVEEYMAEDFPGGKVPPQVTSKKACGWTGKLDEYGKTWT